MVRLFIIIYQSLGLSTDLVLGTALLGGEANRETFCPLTMFLRLGIGASKGLTRVLTSKSSLYQVCWPFHVIDDLSLRIGYVQSHVIANETILYERYCHWLALRYWRSDLGLTFL